MLGTIAFLSTMAGTAFADYTDSPSPTTMVEGSGRSAGVACAGDTAFTGGSVSTALLVAFALGGSRRSSSVDGSPTGCCVLVTVNGDTGGVGLRCPLTERDRASVWTRSRPDRGGTSQWLKQREGCPPDKPGTGR